MVKPPALIRAEPHRTVTLRLMHITLTPSSRARVRVHPYTRTIQPALTTLALMLNPPASHHRAEQRLVAMGLESRPKATHFSTETEP